MRASGAVAIIGGGRAVNFRRRDTAVKLSPTGFAVAALTFALSVALVYSLNGVVPSIFSDIFAGEEEQLHCYH